METAHEAEGPIKTAAVTPVEKSWFSFFPFLFYILVSSNPSVTYQFLDQNTHLNGTFSVLMELCLPFFFLNVCLYLFFPLPLSANCNLWPDPRCPFRRRRRRRQRGAEDDAGAHQPAGRLRPARQHQGADGHEQTGHPGPGPHEARPSGQEDRVQPAGPGGERLGTTVSAKLTVSYHMNYSIPCLWFSSFFSQTRFVSGSHTHL